MTYTKDFSEWFLERKVLNELSEYSIKDAMWMAWQARTKTVVSQEREIHALLDRIEDLKREIERSKK